MTTRIPSAPVLLAVAGARRDVICTALEAAGHEVLVVRDAEELRLALDSQLVGAVVDDGFDGEAEPETWVEGAGGVPLCVLVPEDVSESRLRAWEAVGAEEFVGRSTSASLVVRAVARSAREARGAAGSGAERAEQGRVVDRETFDAHLRSRIPHARSENLHMGIFAMSLHRLGATGDVARGDVDDAVVDRVRHLLECGEDDDAGALGDGLIVTRLDDELYGVLVTGLRRIQDAAKIGGRLANSFLSLPDDVSMDVCSGIALFPEDGADSTTLVGSAVHAAQRVRGESGEQIAFHTASMGRWAFERLTLEKSLRDAIENEELRVYYQPRIDIESRRILGMECLVRWQHPDLGLVSPAQFIPLAEETGLIVPIGEWVLREACRQNAEWRMKGLPAIRISVNLSPVQFRKPDLFESVIAALEDSGLAEDGLELELTESMLMNDPKSTVATLRKLKGAGIHLSIDDFGTGYSSLSYLKRFPIDALKIDRSFVSDITTNPDDAAIATAIILMGHSLRLSVVAEGVETEPQLEFLRVLKCNEIQGYLYSPPVPADRAEAFLAGERKSAA